MALLWLYGGIAKGPGIRLQRGLRWFDSIFPLQRCYGRSVRQRIANPRSGVRFPITPPEYKIPETISGIFTNKNTMLTKIIMWVLLIVIAGCLAEWYTYMQMEGIKATNRRNAAIEAYSENEALNKKLKERTELWQKVTLPVTK